MPIHILSNPTDYKNKIDNSNNFLLFRSFGNNYHKHYSHHDLICLDSSFINDDEDTILKYLETISLSNTVFLNVTSNLVLDEFSPWFDLIFIIQRIEHLFRKYKNNNFVLICSLENVEQYFNSSNLLKVIPFNESLLMSIKKYRNVEPILSKNLNSNYNFISITDNLKFYKLAFLSQVYYRNINDLGIISSTVNKNTYYKNTWRESNSINQTINLGINELLNDALVLNSESINKFELYKDSFIEFICEDNFCEDCFLITEKTLNSIYGCNFPIWISSRGTVKFLRDMGLDVFDDIIDHSYDSIEDPFERINAALDMNMDILTNGKYAKVKWLENKQRFQANVDFVKTKIDKFYNERLNLEINHLHGI